MSIKICYDNRDDDCEHYENVRVCHGKRVLLSRALTVIDIIKRTFDFLIIGFVVSFLKNKPGDSVPESPGIFSKCKF